MHSLADKAWLFSAIYWAGLEGRYLQGKTRRMEEREAREKEKGRGTKRSFFYRHLDVVMAGAILHDLRDHVPVEGQRKSKQKERESLENAWLCCSQAAVVLHYSLPFTSPWSSSHPSLNITHSFFPPSFLYLTISFLSACLHTSTSMHPRISHR